MTKETQDEFEELDQRVRHNKPLLLGVLTCFGGAILVAALSSPGSDQFTHVSAAEHVNRALSACGASFASKRSRCVEPAEAESELQAVQRGDPAYNQAAKLLAAVQNQEYVDVEQSAQKSYRQSVQTAQESREQMVRNVQGVVQDDFTCNPAADQKQVVSFDGGNYWWKDDGRCASRRQHQRDDDAKVWSYWPSKLRVNTDIDSSWLSGEERICQSYPDDKGTVQAVACKGTAGRTDHNIPITFWGGVDRNTVSDWRCRRQEGDDQFICRAIN